MDPGRFRFAISVFEGATEVVTSAASSVPGPRGAACRSPSAGDGVRQGLAGSDASGEGF